MTTGIARQLVREADKDRFLSALFAPAMRRDALFALYAFQRRNCAHSADGT